jgi:hypothetical protein
MIEKFFLDKKLLFRILTSYLIMTVLWSIACFFFDQHFGENRFGLKATGFVSLFCLSFVFGLQVRSLSKIAFLLIVFLVTFYLVSFVVGAISITITDNSLWLTGLIISATSATILVAALNQLKRVQFRYPCIFAIIVFALPTYIPPFKNFEDSIIMFNLWQGLTILPLSLGLCLTRQQRIGGEDDMHVLKTSTGL